MADYYAGYAGLELIHGATEDDYFNGLIDDATRIKTVMRGPDFKHGGRHLDVTPGVWRYRTHIEVNVEIMHDLACLQHVKGLPTLQAFFTRPVGVVAIDSIPDTYDGSFASALHADIIKALPVIECMPPRVILSAGCVLQFLRILEELDGGRPFVFQPP